MYARPHPCPLPRERVNRLAVPAANQDLVKENGHGKSVFGPSGKARMPSDKNRVPESLPPGAAVFLIAFIAQQFLQAAEDGILQVSRIGLSVCVKPREVLVESLPLLKDRAEFLLGRIKVHHRL